MHHYTVPQCKCSEANDQWVPALQLIWKRTAGKNTSAPLILEASHLSLFASFWWLVLSITITSECLPDVAL